MLDRGHQFPSPGSPSAQRGEVFVTTMMARMMHRVLVDNVEAEQAVEEAHNRWWRSTRGGRRDRGDGYADTTRCSETRRDGSSAGDHRTLVVVAPGPRGTHAKIDCMDARRSGAAGG